MKNIIVFASGSGTNFEAIVDACEKGLIDAKVALMVCDNKDAYVIERAKNHNVPSFVFEFEVSTLLVFLFSIIIFYIFLKNKYD
jgi:folate-dependent phosphoribosylglycinamide formyltransferase PurN